MRDRRVVTAGALAAALVAIALLAPHPSVSAVREWSESAGAALPLAFFVLHALVTVAPVPRTVFTLCAGLLFGPFTGITLAVAASTVSALVAFGGVRWIGRDLVWQHISHPAIRRVDERVAASGWLAVGSLRLIAFAPFSVVNYVCGVSSIRALPYTLATIVGILPGTVAVVVLGDALTGGTDPRLVVVSAACVALGIAGLLLDARRGRTTTNPDSIESSSQP
ncbi:TVP38/TMEM64 family protein [Rhodococcus sp. HNM0569]|uniref:TVP38/TMEM64 family protein n=1 Tax=Rhodococcus sp. HNM0569 TaxID=2716340 RepID=UPI003211D756